MDLEQIENNSGIGFVFDYVPNLTVVGTSHRMDNQERDLLNSLIDEAEFVAVESDEYRIKNNNNIKIRTSKNKRGFVPERNELYLWWLHRLFINIKFGIYNEYLDENSGPKRDNTIDEMGFSYETAINQGKDVYVVDVPIYKTIKDMCYKTSLKDKAKSILTVISDFNLREPESINDIIIKNREEFMLEEIEKHEGPLEKLSRKGLLVVGGTHAINYYKSKINY